MSEIDELKKVNVKLDSIEKNTQKGMKAEFLKAGSAIVIALMSGIFTIY